MVTDQIVHRTLRFARKAMLICSHTEKLAGILKNMT
jgi:hypothetical protein